MAYETVYLDAVESVWQAIENHEDTRDLFTKRIKFLRSGHAWNKYLPALSDLTAIAIRTVAINPKWYTNKDQRDSLVLLIRVWTKDWDERLPLVIAAKLKRAIHDARPQGSQKRYTADNPPASDFGAVTFSPKTLSETDSPNSGNGIEVMEMDFRCVMRCAFQPRTS